MLPSALVGWVVMSGPAAVVAALRERAERGYGIDAGSLRIALSPRERLEVARLLGSPWDRSGSPVSLRLLATKLREHGLTTRELLEAVGGPILAKADLREAALDRESALRAAAEGALAEAGIPPLVAATWAAEAPPRDIDGTADLIARVWRALPGGDGTVRLAALAADVFNDAHALDGTEHLGRVVARLAATVHGLPPPGRTGAAWRTAWRSIGVRCDTVSSRVLVLNLPLTGESPVARVCAAALGEPAWLTQRMLERPWSCEPITVHVCENPTIVEAAADALGRECPPLVCTDGIATIAVISLVGGLAAAGCRVIARADFDEAGLTVVEQIRAAAPDMVAWRFDQVSYAALVPSAADAVDLRAAIKTGGPIHEERLLDSLVEDLRRVAGRRAPGAVA